MSSGVDVDALLDIACELDGNAASDVYVDPQKAHRMAWAIRNATWAKGATAIMVVTVPVVTLSLSIAAGIAFGAAWGFASSAVMVAACAAIVVWAAKKG